MSGSRDFLVAVMRTLEYASTPGTRRPSCITVSVTEKTARRRLRIKKGQPITYQGVELKCVGTRAWRLKQQPVPVQESI